MKRVISILGFMIILSALVACKHAAKPGEYLNYMKATQNGLMKKIGISGWEYTFQYKPSDYIILMENNGNPTSTIVTKRTQELQGTVWFNISFKLSDEQVSPLRFNIGSKEEYDARLNYFLNEAMHNLQLVYNHKDTLKQIGYVFETNYNLTPHEMMVVGFELPVTDKIPAKDMQLVYADQEFKNGIIKVTFKSEDIKNIPNLVY